MAEIINAADSKYTKTAVLTCDACGKRQPVSYQEFYDGIQAPHCAPGGMCMLFPWPEPTSGYANKELETIDLCPECGKKVAEYVAHLKSKVDWYNTDVDD